MVRSGNLKLPPELAGLYTLACDLRWTWNHEADRVWQMADAETWRRTHNPWIVLQTLSATQHRRLAADKDFRRMLEETLEGRRAYLRAPGWARSACPNLGRIAYFSMEFGLGAVLPIYAGGLGVLAGDYIKTASDLGIPIIGIGLLYQEGYFRQTIDADGNQLELYPHNEPETLPVEPVMLPDEGWLKISLALPGRMLQLRVWQVTVGRNELYLLDSNDPLNDAADRGITAKLYGAGSETRLLQELVLGIGGWRVVAALRPETELCHVNEGHAAFAILERARALAVKSGMSFREALWATRAGNIFTTHTPLPAAFDRFPIDMLRKYLFCMKCEIGDPEISEHDLLRLGQADGDAEDMFNMAYLAVRGSAKILGVSRLHGTVSREIFQPLFPRRPRSEVPIDHVTNGVHIPSWDSRAADRLWTDACGKERWRSVPEDMAANIATVDDKDLWAMRGEGRQRLVTVAREALIKQLGGRGLNAEIVGQAENVLDPNVLTLGFARRFTDYKRPNLLLREPERLDAILADTGRPVQLVIAGKAYPADMEGKRMIAEWVQWAQNPARRRRVVFLEDYDIALAQEMVQGVDVWINTPRRPWEACGTSGMKILVNGGLNCSVRDGWWDEGYSAEVGWAIGNGKESSSSDESDANSLYALLESQIVPEFYDRDDNGLPRHWLTRIRNSMSRLTPAFSSTRMLRQYVETAYLPAKDVLTARSRDQFAAAKRLVRWSDHMTRHWQDLHIGEPLFSRAGALWQVSVPVFLGAIDADEIRIELFAENGATPDLHPLGWQKDIPGSTNGHVYTTSLPANRPATDYTVRILPNAPEPVFPAEAAQILWQR